MKKQTLWSLLSLMVVMAVLVAACGPQATEAPAEPGEGEAEPTEPPAEAEAVTIDVWFHSGKGEERDALDAQVEDFNAMQDEV